MVWLVSILLLLVIAVVVLRQAGRRAWSAWKAVTREVAQCQDDLSSHLAFLDRLGTPSDTYRQTREAASEGA